MLHISLKAEELFRIGTFPITNGLLLALIVSTFLAGLAILSRPRLRLVPGGFQNVTEALFEGILSFMDSVLGERRKSEKYLPLVATIFIFVLFSNWFGLLPIVGSLGLHEKHAGEHGPEAVFTPLLRAPGADLNFTLALAVIAVFTVNVFGTLAVGVKSHFSKFFNFKSAIGFFIGILELISEFAKIISFSFRLFGNIFAGEVLLVIVGFLVPYFIPLPFLFLEAFVGFIQAFVFAMLALVFVTMATAEHGSGH